MSDPVLPPLLTLEGTDVSDPLAAACEGAAAGRHGAGDVLWNGNTARVEFAIVLEPEVALDKAAQMLPVAMVACTDCLGALTPPQVGVMLRWPDIISVNGGEVGRVTLAAPETVGQGCAPDWLVLGIELRLAREPNAPEPGLCPDVTSLDEEGCTELTATKFIESCCRHFLTWLHTWETDGFAPVRSAWTFRAEGRDRTLTFTWPGRSLSGEFADLDKHGNLLVKTESGAPLKGELVEAVSRWPVVVESR